MFGQRKFFVACLAIVLVTAAMTPLVACSSTRSTEVQIDDAGITAKVKAKLIADPQVKAYQIDVDTLRGVVTLSGEVDEAVAKSEAEKLAKDTEDVRRVINNIKVVPKN